MKKVTLNVILLALVTSKPILACDYSLPPSYGEQYKDSNTVFVAKVDSISIKPPLNPSLLKKYFSAQHSNTKVYSEIEKIQFKIDQLKNTKNLSDKIKNLEKTIKNKVSKKDASKIKNLLSKLDQKIQNINTENNYIEDSQTKSLEAERAQYRNEYAKETGKVIETKYQLEILKLKKKSKNIQIEKYRKQIKELQNQLTNLRSFTTNYTVEATLLKKYKGDSPHKISISYERKRSKKYRPTNSIISSSSWMNCANPYDFSEFDLDNLLFSVKKNEVIGLFKGDKRATSWINFGQKPESEWAKVMTKIQNGNYYRHENDFLIHVSEVVNRAPTEAQRIIDFGSTVYPTYFNNTYMPKKQCDKKKKTMFDSINIYNQANKVVVAKVENMDIAINNNSDFQVKQKNYTNSIGLIIQRIEDKRASQKLNQKKSLVKELNKDFWSLKKRNKETTQNLESLDRKLKYLQNSNNHEEYFTQDIKREELIKSKQSELEKLKTLELDYHISKVLLNFIHEDMNTYKTHLRQLDNLKNKVHNYYAGKIDVDFQILDTFKGNISIGDTLNIKSQKRNNALCHDDENNMLYKFKLNNYYVLHLDKKNNILKWNRIYSYSDYLQGFLETKMQQIKSGSYRDRLPTKTSTKKSRTTRIRNNYLN